MQKNISLFEDEEKISSSSKKISVTFAAYKNTEQVEADDLFRGFSELHAVTYSIGLRQVENVMKFFERGEVIIGSHEQISLDVAAMIALQKIAVDCVSKNNFLQRLIKSGAFKFYVTDRVHAKIYLMRADDGRCRVILASANFSANAWQNRQRENFVVMDEPEAYEHYLNVFDNLRRNSADEIDVDARPLKDDGTNLELLPAIKNVVASKRAIVLHELPPESKEEAEYFFVQRSEAEKFRALFKEVGVHPNPQGKTLIVVDKIQRVKNLMKSEHEKVLARQKNRSTLAPEFLLDYDNHRATFNGEVWNLNPSADEIRADIKNLLEYVQGTKIFTGDTSQLQTTYWKIILYMFASPFFARLRYFYSSLVPPNSTGKVFPMYMILRGRKSGGKSLIVTTGQKLMFDRILPAIPAKEIAPSKMESFKLTIKGCPILVDDANNRNLQYMKEFVKDDYSLINGKIFDHGTFIFTSNDAEQVKQEISKRVVVFGFDSQLNDDVAVQRDTALKKIQNRMHNALYRNFLAKIFPKVDALTEEIIAGEKEDWFPDIFRIAAETLTEIFREHGFDIPSELKIFTWKDYLGEKIKSNQAVVMIENLFELKPEIFSVDASKDRLTINLSSLDQKTQINVSELFEAELPPSTERTRVGNIVTMKLSEIKKFARVTFADDKNLLQKFFSLFKRS